MASDSAAAQDDFPAGHVLESYFRQLNEDEFPRYGEPLEGTNNLVTVPLNDQYLNGLHDFIGELSKHCHEIQIEEKAKLEKLNNGLKEVAKKRSEEQQGEPADQTAREEFEHEIEGLRYARTQYRKLIKDAMEQKQKFLDAVWLAQQEDRAVYRSMKQLRSVGTVPQAIKGRDQEWSHFFWSFFVVQALINLAYIWSFRYDDGTDAANVGTPLRADDLYSFAFQIALLVVVGLSMASAKFWMYGFTGFGQSMLLALFSIEWGFLVRVIWLNIEENDSRRWDSLHANLPNFVYSLYVAAACLISFGVFVGKVTTSEVMLIGFIEAFVYGLNTYLLQGLLKVSDPGGAITLHLFAASFGIGVSSMLSRTLDPTFRKGFVRFKLDKVYAALSSNNNGGTSSNIYRGSYHGEWLSLLGTIIMFTCFPAFNAVFAPNGTQHRVLINTLVSSMFSVCAAYIASRTLRRRGFYIGHAQLAVLSGSISMGSCHSFLIEPGSAALIGLVAGGLSVLFDTFGRRYFEDRSPLRMYDTRGIVFTHGTAGLIAGLASTIACSVLNQYLYDNNSDIWFEKPRSQQGGLQAAGTLISMGVGLSTGFVVSWMLYFIRRYTTHPHIRTIFDDRREWNVPQGFPSRDTEPM